MMIWNSKERAWISLVSLSVILALSQWPSPALLGRKRPHTIARVEVSERYVSWDVTDQVDHKALLAALERCRCYRDAREVYSGETYLVVTLKEGENQFIVKSGADWAYAVDDGGEHWSVEKPEKLWQELELIIPERPEL